MYQSHQGAHRPPSYTQGKLRRRAGSSDVGGKQLLAPGVAALLLHLGALLGIVPIQGGSGEHEEARVVAKHPAARLPPPLPARRLHPPRRPPRAAQTCPIGGGCWGACPGRCFSAGRARLPGHSLRFGRVCGGCRPEPGRPGASSRGQRPIHRGPLGATREPRQDPAAGPPDRARRGQEPPPGRSRRPGGLPQSSRPHRDP